MKVKLLEDDERFKLKKGDVFTAQRYQYDPDKITLLERESDGFDPGCNQYKESLAFWMSSGWYVIKDNRYVPIEE